MRKTIVLLGIIALSLLSFTSNAQLIINQSIVETGPYKVGDTITVKYTVIKGTTTPRYFWLRYQYNNKALQMVTNSNTFSQGSSSQTYYTHWNNYLFTQNPNIGVGELYNQYQSTPWNYSANSDWNVGQLTVQRTDVAIDGVIATQKYIIKDQNTYNNVHKLDLAYAINLDGSYVPNIGSQVLQLSLSNVSGNTSQFKVRVLFPQGYPITDHSVQLMHLKTDGSGDIDWTKQPIVQKPLDSSGEVIFTSGVKVGDSVGVFIGAAFQKAWMNNVLTVSDAYKAFLGHSQTDITGTPTFFTRPNFEKKIGNITKNDNTFNESDSYYIFAHIMGMDVSTNAFTPTSTATSVRWYSGLLNQSWLDGSQKYRVNITQPQQTVDAVFAWGGDLDWSHSSDPSEIASRISSGNYLNSINAIASIGTMEYTPAELEKATLSLTSKLEGGKVVLSTTLSKADLAGIELILQYDNTKLTLDNVVFDAGNTVTNFSTIKDNRITFGSIDQTKTARVKVGTPYRLIFTPKVDLANTAGLFYFVLADAVNSEGKKINLIVE